MVYIYARTANETGFALEAQVDACIEKAKELGLENVIIKMDIGSGLEFNPGLQEILDTIKPGDTMILVSIDRLSRKPWSLIEQLDQVNIVTVQEGNLDGKLFTTLKKAIIEFEKKYC